MGNAAMYEAMGRRLAAQGPRTFIPHEPTAKQAEFLSLTCFEALYGGAAGGGKSDAELMAALQYVHVPGYSALLLRRTYADLSLPGAIMDRAKDWLVPRGVEWNDKEKRFTFPSGATLTFGYLDTERDRFRYQGAEFQFIGFDELTQFPEQWYRYLLSRIRRLKTSSVPLRVRNASNPGGIGHDWVRRRFVESPTPDRAFIPATLADNPYLDADAYRVALEQLDPTTRKQLLEGVWVRDGEGLVYYAFDEARNVCGEAKCQNYVLGIDYGFTDPTAFSVVGWNDHDPCAYVVESFKVEGMTPSDAAEAVVELRGRYDFSRIVADIGGLGKGYAEEARRRFHLPIEPAEKTNKLGFIKLLNGDLSHGRVKVAQQSAAPLLTEWLELPLDDSRAKEADGFENHCADATLYAWRACWAFIQKPPAPAKTPEQQQRADLDSFWAKDSVAQKSSRDREWWDEGTGAMTEDWGDGF
jgi:hypothetical protein